MLNETAEKKTEPSYYKGLDGLRTIACIGIILMHMLSRDNNSYILPKGVEKVILSFTDFVFLFMAISAFGLCCGYYDRILSRQVDLVEFYKKRYMKVLPFFSLIVFIDVIVEFSREVVIEALADVSLSFGLFPNNITVIGVAWYLGLVFAFYMIFPFYCVLMRSKKNAWMTFGISLVLNYMMDSYFGLSRQNIVFSFCFFVLGGLIYLYKDKLKKIEPIMTIFLVVISVCLFFRIGSNTYTQLLLTFALMVFAISDLGGILFQNIVFKFISQISLELYLCHMVIFRGIERLKLNTRFGNGIVQYIVTISLVISFSIIFIIVVKKIGEKLKCIMVQKKN